MPAPEPPSSNNPPRADPILVDYDKLFAQPIVRSEPFTTPPNPAFVARHRNALWWILIFAVITITAAALLIADASDPFVDPPCE